MSYLLKVAIAAAEEQEKSAAAVDAGTVLWGSAVAGSFAGAGAGAYMGRNKKLKDRARYITTGAWGGVYAGLATGIGIEMHRLKNNPGYGQQARNDYYKYRGGRDNSYYKSRTNDDPGAGGPGFGGREARHSNKTYYAGSEAYTLKDHAAAMDMDMSKFTTKKEVNTHYRNKAKLNHPDLATDEVDKARRNKDLGRLNGAFDAVKASDWYEKLAMLRDFFQRKNR